MSYLVVKLYAYRTVITSVCFRKAELSGPKVIDISGETPEPRTVVELPDKLLKYVIDQLGRATWER